MTTLEEIVKKTRQASGAIALAVVSRDGVVIAADMPQNVSKETFSIMCATILGAGMTAASELGKAAPSRVLLESEDVNIVIHEAGRRAMVVAVAQRSSDLGQIEDHLEHLVSAASSQI